jgi:hypothetical protein
MLATAAVLSLLCSTNRQRGTAAVGTAGDEFARNDADYLRA